MSKFDGSSAFFKRNNNQQINITTKISQKEQKKQNKNPKNSKSLKNISDNEFDKLMNKNEEHNNINFSNSLGNYLNGINNSEIIIKLIQDKIKDEDFIHKIYLKNFTGSQVLKSILEIYSNPENYNWIELQEYGKVLQNLLENNIDEQLLCLLIIQEYTIKLGLPKIIYKNSQVYYIKLIFQLLFTYDIIEETTFWKWHELYTTLIDVDDDIKKKICIQTTGFFNILKLTFTDQDYEIENDIDKIKNDFNHDNNEHNKQVINEDDKKNNYDNKDVVPEEQDYYMEENDFDINDL